MFCRLLGDASLSDEVRRFSLHEDHRYDDMFAHEGSIQDGGVEAHRLKDPTATDILSMTRVTPVKDESVRAAMLKSMRTAAEKRLDGVTKNKRRRWYEHATLLATACSAVDTSEVSHVWLADIRKRYRRYPALQRWFDELASLAIEPVEDPGLVDPTTIRGKPRL
jgi:hypothetical protein